MSCYLLSINDKTGDLLCCDDIGCPDVLPAYKINKQTIRNNCSSSSSSFDLMITVKTSLVSVQTDVSIPDL